LGCVANRETQAVASLRKWGRVYSAMADASRNRLARWLSPGRLGVVLLVLVAVPCVVTLPWSVHRYDVSLEAGQSGLSPSVQHPMGTDMSGKSLLWQCLLGGAISLSIGLAAAAVAVVIGVSFGAVAGYAGGYVDAVMMRFVDVMYGLPYILLVVLINIAARPGIEWAVRWVLSAEIAAMTANIVTLLVAIGGVAWLTMARVIRGQVLSLREQPFIEAARAAGLPTWRILLRHMLPNLAGPIVVYATLTVPQAILQESFLSFLGIGVRAPLPSWGLLAAEGTKQLGNLGMPGLPFRWWLVFWPCTLLGLTLLGLNLVGDALRDRLDPRGAGR